MRCSAVIAGAADAPFCLEEMRPRPARVAASEFALGKRFFGTLHYVICLLRQLLHFRECIKQRFFRNIGEMCHRDAPRNSEARGRLLTSLHNHTGANEGVIWVTVPCRKTCHRPPDSLPT